MTTWLLIRRLRGPAFLILFGITAMLNQWGVLGFGRSWPLYLILAGLLGLAERAALAGRAGPRRAAGTGSAGSGTRGVLRGARRGLVRLRVLRARGARTRCAALAGCGRARARGRARGRGTRGGRRRGRRSDRRRCGRSRRSDRGV